MNGKRYPRKQTMKILVKINQFLVLIWAWFFSWIWKYVCCCTSYNIGFASGCYYFVLKFDCPKPEYLLHSLCHRIYHCCFVFRRSWLKYGFRGWAYWPRLFMMFLSVGYNYNSTSPIHTLLSVVQIMYHQMIESSVNNEWEHRREQSHSNYSYCAGMCLEGLTKVMNVRPPGLRQDLNPWPPL